MATINSVSGTSSTSGTGSTSGSSWNRVSGLVSGIDTESMVKSLTAAARTKIQKLQQQKQLLTWKQDDYRTVTQSLTDFKNKYFQSWSSDSVLNAGFFKKLTVTSSASQYVTATANADASAGIVEISDISSLASAARLESLNPVTKPIEISVDTAGLSSLSGKSVMLTVDGTAKELKFADQTYSNADDVKAELQGLIDNAFGTGRVTVTNSSGTLSLDAQGSKVIIGKVGRTADEAYGILNFTDGQSSRLNVNSRLSDLSLATPLSDTVDFTVNGTHFQFTKNQTISDVINTVNTSTAGVKLSYSSVTDKFTFTAASTGAGQTIVQADGENSNFLSAILGAGKFTEGSNAQLTINGTTVIRSSNTFNVDGITYNILGKAADGSAENVSLNVGLDVDKMVTGIKDFVDSYNKIIAGINDKLNEERDSDYPPLTDDQKAEMSESEITKWEDKAKSGLLRKDEALEQIVSGMRTALFTDVKQVDGTAGIGVYLTQMGITTGSYTDGGKLTIDENKLRSALTENPDAVARLFTQKSGISSSSGLTSDQRTKRYGEEGLAWRLSDILDDNVRTIRDASGKKGKLLELAGISGDISEYNNSIYTQIAVLNKNITSANDQLTSEEDRYWTKFNAMESALQQLNAQSSWLASQFNTGSSS